MIQWCMDCKHSYGFDQFQADYCRKCLDNSECGEIPVGYEQVEQEDEQWEN